MTRQQRGVVLYFLKEHRDTYVALLLLSLAIALLEASSVFIVLPLFSTLLGGPTAEQGLGLPGRLLETAAGWLPLGDRVARLCLLIIAFTLAKFAATVAAQRRMARSSGDLLYRIRRRLLETYAGAPYEYFLDTPQGRIVYLATSGSAKLSHLLLKLPEAGTELARVSTLAALLVWLNWQAALGLFAVGAAFDRVVRLLSARLSYTYGRGRFDSSNDQSVILNEFLNGVKQLRLFGVATAWIARFDDASRRYMELFVRDTALLLVPKPLLEAAAVTLVFGAVMVMHRLRPGQAASDLPVLAAFAMAAMKLLPSVSALSRARLEIMSDLADAESLHAVLTERHPAPRGGQVRFHGLDRGIRLQDVRFAYKGRGELLKGLTVDIPRHKRTAFAGDSGSGKTTILNLLLGLYEPSSGRILVDDGDLLALDLRSWLDRIAVVTQDPFIFHATVADNIVFGRSGFSKEAVENAARVAQAHGFVSELPQGYATVVGERGMKLSGGQQQRLAIARAVLGDPEILIFDEATSALDAHSEAAVQEAIEAASAGRTVIQVAHRLSTIRRSDKIVVLHDGRVAEEGTHDELMRREGRYRAFLDRQSEAASA